MNKFLQLDEQIFTIRWTNFTIRWTNFYNDMNKFLQLDESNKVKWK